MKEVFIILCMCIFVIVVSVLLYSMLSDNTCVGMENFETSNDDDLLKDNKGGKTNEDIITEDNPIKENPIEETELNSYRYRDLDRELIQSGLTIDIHGLNTFRPEAVVPTGVATMMDYSRRFIDEQFDATRIPIVNYTHRC